MASILRSAVPILAVIAGLSAVAQPSDSDDQIDYAPILSRGFGVSDEPSVLEQCDSGYSGIRVFEQAAGRPLALVRIERTEGGAQITRRIFEHGRASRMTQTRVSEAEWAELVGLIDQSGFWTYERNENLWMPDSPTVFIEACLTRRFRSISLYPERTELAVDIVDFLSDLAQ